MTEVTLVIMTKFVVDLAQAANCVTVKVLARNCIDSTCQDSCAHYSCALTKVECVCKDVGRSIEGLVRTVAGSKSVNQVCTVGSPAITNAESLAIIFVDPIGEELALRICQAY